MAFCAYYVLTTALGAVSFLHRFGSAFKRYVHLRACGTDGVFRGTPSGVAFRPARPVTAAELVLPHDDRDTIQAAPDDLQAIDIHAR